VATGEAHGTMTIIVGGEPFEVTTLRIDVETDGRRAEVEFTRSFEEDAARRDLTFNAMSMDFEGNLFDYFNGRQDLEGRIVRFVGDARQRVEEDYLRILRYFRFAARFNAMPEPAVLDMFMDPAIQDGLRRISVERYWLEMSKLFMAPGAVVTLALMENFHVLETIGIPGPLNDKRFAWADDASAKLSTFIPNTKGDAQIAEDFCKAWKLSREVMDKVLFLIKRRDDWFYSEPAVEDLLVDGTPRDWVVSWVKITGDDSEYAETYVPPVFPVRGQDLLAQDMKPGPEMGQKLKVMKEAWKRSRFQLTKEELLAENA
jgi:tRNA nucleotidyltransferase (CCA-adding enzyme)